MKAVRIVEIGRPLVEQEIPRPKVSDGEVLVRVRAAGICHSDVHYQHGKSSVDPPITPGHEVAGEVAEIGPGVNGLSVGERVCLHYVTSCGRCYYCARGLEQFCSRDGMIGKSRDGGYAEYICVPARCAVVLPESISFEHAAVMMCASATSLHALHKGRLAAGEVAAVYGAGGLGLSAIQLALALGAVQVMAVDINPDNLALAQKVGALPVNAAAVDPVEEIRRLNQGRGVDVALELIGLPLTMGQAVRSLGVMGRAVMVGIDDRPLPLYTYRELIGPEAEVIGSNDHQLWEIHQLLDFYQKGLLKLDAVVTKTVGLDADAVNREMDRLHNFSGQGRCVIVP